MKILIEMPEPRKPDCELCGQIHHPHEVCPEELDGVYLEPTWKTKRRELTDENN